MNGQKRNKLGICEWVLPAKGVEAIQAASKAGYAGIQLADQGGSTNGFPLCEKKTQEVLLEASQRLKVQFQALHLFTLVRQGGMIFPADTPEGQSARTSIQKGIEACRAMHIPALMLTSGFACQIENEDQFINFSRMLSYACDLADDNGINIAFESILTIPEIRRMRELTGGRVRICYDTFNMIRFGRGNPLKDINQLALAEIDHFHVKDAPADLIGCALLGSGCGAFDRVAELIRSKGYSGWFINENNYLIPPLSERDDPISLAGADLLTMQKMLA